MPTSGFRHLGVWYMGEETIKKVDEHFCYLQLKKGLLVGITLGQNCIQMISESMKLSEGLIQIL